MLQTTGEKAGKGDAEQFLLFSISHGAYQHVYSMNMIFILILIVAKRGKKMGGGGMRVVLVHHHVAPFVTKK